MADETEVPGEPDTGSVKKSYDLSKDADLYALLREEKNEDAVKANVTSHVESIVRRHNLESYRVVLLFDDCDSISSYHANKIYEAASFGGGGQDIFLVLSSSGGKVEPAYLISKTCKRLSKDKFVVAVPRRAKSAATLISLGADEIHMGLMSELGPIDPQIGGYPALGLTNALNKLASLACAFPGSADMFATYLTKNLNLRDLGYFDRVTESAAQYAERLLTAKSLPDGKTASSLADHFVNHYKDHSFVIDVDEAIALLGMSVVRTETDEYRCANEIYKFLDFFGLLLRYIRKEEYYYVGAVADGLVTRAIKSKS